MARQWLQKARMSENLVRYNEGAIMLMFEFWTESSKKSISEQTAYEIDISYVRSLLNKLRNKAANYLVKWMKLTRTRNKAVKLLYVTHKLIAEALLK